MDPGAFLCFLGKLASVKLSDVPPRQDRGESIPVADNVFADVVADVWCANEIGYDKCGGC